MRRGVKPLSVKVDGERPSRTFHSDPNTTYIPRLRPYLLPPLVRIGADFIRQPALDGFERSREVPQPGGLLEDSEATQLVRPFRNGDDHLTHVVDV